MPDTLLLKEDARDDEVSIEGNMTYRSVFKPGLFDGRMVIVTGGGSGIGRCTAHELAALGASVALVGRNPEKLEKVITGSCIRIDGGGPNARRMWWKLEPSEKSQPFNGFHRASTPKILSSAE